MFGDFGIGFGAGALPVELLFFQAKAMEHSVKLFWQTASETHNDYFVVERSRDGNHFEDLIQVAGAHNSNTLRSYLTEDKNPFNGINYYKLRQVDFNGDKQFSDIVAVRFDNSTHPMFSVFPNPVTDEAFISIHAEKNEKLYFELMDAVGKQLRKTIFVSSSSEGYSTSILNKKRSNCASGKR